MPSLTVLAPFLLLTAAAAITGGRFTPGAWYDTLDKPSWTPPSWLFPVAWTVLYVMIAVAGALAYQAGGLGPAVAIWGIQLCLNALWSYVMFGQRNIGGALLDLVGLWLAIVAFIVAVWPIDATAALLFLPYLAWVSFAGLLNFAVLRRNPSQPAGVDGV